MPEKVVSVYRGNVVESVHYGHFIAVDSNGEVLYKLGDPETVTFMRSSAKPFQAIALVESGAAHSLKLSPKEIAVIAGSHSGEPEHVETVAGILEKIGLGPENLQCGSHVPHSYTARKLTPPPGEQFSVLQHNCSGTHAGMLALCVFKNLPIENYLDPSHPVQEQITEAIAYVCDYPREKIKIGVDGCSAPAHALPLFNIAYGYARLISPHSVPAAWAKVYSSVYWAMLDHPDIVAGEMRFDTELMKASGEKLIAKGGAEGIHCVGLIERGWGIAAKISDGANRAIYPFSLEALHQIGVLDQAALTRLSEFYRPVLRNWTDKEVGHIRAEFELKKA